MFIMDTPAGIVSLKVKDYNKLTMYNSQMTNA